jgi:hypothetical protein
MRCFNSWILGFISRSQGQKCKFGQVEAAGTSSFMNSLRHSGCAAFRPQREPQLPPFLTQHLPRILHETHFILARACSFQTPTSSSPVLTSSRWTPIPWTSINRIEFYLLIYFHWCVSQLWILSEGRNFTFLTLFWWLGQNVGKWKLREINKSARALLGVI